MCNPLERLNIIFNLENPNITLKIRERERERERERGFGKGKKNRVVGLLKLDCTFPFYIYFLK